jgi:ferrous-iron efflux pump FieF
MPDTHTVAQRQQLLKRASYASVSTALLLIVVKLGAWMLTGSVSILASLVDSLMDSIASLINLFAIRYSLQPADTEHRFGHGKAEALAGLAQAAFICGSAGFLMLHAIDRLRHPYMLQALAVGVWVMLVAIVLTLLLLLYQRHVIKVTGSTAIRADALHYASDLLGNISVIAALLLASMGWTWADPLFAMLVAVYIVYSAFQIGYEAVQQLMDRELPDAIKKQIVAIARRDPQVHGVHELRTRQSGQTMIVQLHLELDDHLPLIHAHAIADRVEKQICAAFPGSQVIVHQDPASLNVSKPQANY